jgi:inosose dehydratase
LTGRAGCLDTYAIHRGETADQPELAMQPNPLTSSGAALSRRHFLKLTGATVGGSALASLLPAGRLLSAPAPGAADREEPVVGSQLYGWGQYYQRMGKDLNDHLDEVLAAIRDCGYDYAEGSLDVEQPENSRRFADQLRAKGLRPVSIYAGARLHEKARADEAVKQLLRAAAVCHQAGFRVLNCNPEPIGREKTDAELRVQAAALSQLGAGLNGLGLRLGIHNHTPAMRDHAREFNYNFRHTDPRLVGFCFDVHWVYRGGVPPLQALAEYGDRVVCWHLRQSRGGIWWEDLDTGDIDYAAIAAYVGKHHLTRRYTVELALENGTKVTRSVVENHRRSREFVRRVFGC